MGTKRCSRCKQAKPLSEYWVRRKSKDGLTGECKPCCLELQRIHYWRFRDSVLAKNRIRQKKYRVQRNERERLRKINLRATPELTRSQWERIKRKHKQRCYYCGIKHDKLTIDHVVPISKGGDNSLCNIVPACITCNRLKGSKSLVEWVRALK